MEIEEVIRGRRSIRKYKSKDVPDSVIEELLDCARYAPSSMNGQPWYFIVVRSKETKEELARIKNEYCPEEKKMYRADFLQDAPVIIVVCVDRERSYDREVENGVLAAANILLGAYSRGLGSVYMSAYKTGEPEVSGKIRKVLAVPEHITPITLLPLGYPDETPEPKSVRSKEVTVFYETYRK